MGLVWFRSPSGICDWSHPPYEEYSLKSGEQNQAHLGCRPCLLYRFATAIDQLIRCQSACTSGNSYLSFYHRRQLPQLQITSSPLPGLCKAKFIKRFFRKYHSTYILLYTVKLLTNRRASPIFSLKKHPKSVLLPPTSDNKRACATF